jgi:hypothetical protein
VAGFFDGSDTTAVATAPLGRRHGIVDTTPERIRITRQRLAGFPSVSG